MYGGAAPAHAPGGDAGEGPDALPFDLLAPARDRTLELAVRQRVREQTGLELGYVEQLYTFGDRDRDPLVREVGVRVISVAYLAMHASLRRSPHRTPRRHWPAWVTKAVLAGTAVPWTDSPSGQVQVASGTPFLLPARVQAKLKQLAS